MAHTAQYHTFIRCEGNTLLRKLPEEARQSLRYFETVGLLSHFKPLPPLESSRKTIAGKAYYYVAITDWSLYLLTKDNKVEGSVLLEVPWLGIRELEKTETDSDDFMQHDPKKPQSVIRSVAISLYPQADLTALPPAFLRKAGLSRDAGSPRSVDHGQAMKPRSAAGCCGRGSKAVDAVAQPTSNAHPSQPQPQPHPQARVSSPHQLQSVPQPQPVAQEQPAHSNLLTPPHQHQNTPQATYVMPPSPEHPSAQQPQRTHPHLHQPSQSELLATDPNQHPHPHPHNHLQPQPQPLSQLAIPQYSQPEPPMPSPQRPSRHTPTARPTQSLARTSNPPSQSPAPRPPLYLDFAMQPVGPNGPAGPVMAGTGAPCQLLHHMWHQHHQYQNQQHAAAAAGVPQREAYVESYIASPQFPTYTNPANGQLYSDAAAAAAAGWTSPAASNTSNMQRGGHAGIHPGWLHSKTHMHHPSPPQQQPPQQQYYQPQGQHYTTYTLHRMPPGPLGEAVEAPPLALDPAALRTHSATTATAAATAAATNNNFNGSGSFNSSGTMSQRRQNLFSTLRRRGEDGATTQANSTLAFARTNLLRTKRGEDAAAGGAAAALATNTHMPSSPSSPSARNVSGGADIALHKAVEEGLRQLDASLRRQQQQQEHPRSPIQHPPIQQPNMVPQPTQPLAQHSGVAPSRLGGVPVSLNNNPPSRYPGTSTTDTSRIPFSTQPRSPPQTIHTSTHITRTAQTSLASQRTGATSVMASTISVAAWHSPPQQQQQPQQELDAPLPPPPAASTASLFHAFESEQHSGEFGFPTVTRRGRRSRNLPPEPGDFRLPNYSSSQPAAAVAGVTEPLLRLGERVLERQRRLQPQSMWEEQQRREEAARKAAATAHGQHQPGGGDGAGAGAGGGGGTQEEAVDGAVDDAYEDFWVPDEGDEKLTAEEAFLSTYRLVLVTIERKSNLFFHVQRAWLGARMRLALTEAGLRGMPLWYAPAFLPIRVVADTASDTANHHGGVVQLPSASYTDAIDALDATQQALRYFSDPNSYPLGLSTANPTSASSAALALFPGDSPVLSRTFTGGSPNAGPERTASWEEGGERLRQMFGQQPSRSSRKSMQALLLAASSRVGAVGPGVRLSREPSRLSVGGRANSGGITSDGGGGGARDLNVTVSSSFLSLYDALRARRQDRLTSILGRSLSMELPPYPEAVAESLELAEAQQYASVPPYDGGAVAGAALRRKISWHPTVPSEAQAGRSSNEGRTSAPAGAMAPGAVGYGYNWSPFRIASGAGAGPLPDSAPWYSPPSGARPYSIISIGPEGTTTHGSTAPYGPTAHGNPAPPSRQPPRRSSTLTNLSAAANVAAFATVAADRYSEQQGGLDARGFYAEVEAEMRVGCSVFDDRDLRLMQEIILERAFSPTPKARQLSKCFLSSKAAASFIISRLYAWGALCAMFSGPPPPPSSSSPSRSPGGSKSQQPSSTRRSLRRSSTASNVRRSISAERVRNVEGAERTSTSQPDARASAATAAAAAAMASAATASVTAAPVAGGGRALGEALERSSELTRDLPASGGGGREGTIRGTGIGVGSASWLEEALTRLEGSNSPSASTYTPPPPPSLRASQPAPSPEPASTSRSTPSTTPYPPSESADVPPLVASAEPEIYDRPNSDRHGSTTTVSGSRVTASRASRKKELSELPPKKTPDELAADLEEETAFFQRLHDQRSWARFGRRAPRSFRHLLPRLGLSSYENTSIRSTVHALAGILQVQQQRTTQGPLERRDPTPPPRAPPTLHADPLSLSPLQEAPFLFALRHSYSHPPNGHPYSHPQPQPHLRGHDRGGSSSVTGTAEEVLDALTGRGARLEGQVRGGLAAAGGGGRVAYGLRSAFLRAFIDTKSEPSEELLGGPGVELWERLMGRLVARLAYKRIQRLLYWVQQELAFSEGCEERLYWLSEELVEGDPDDPPPLDWSFGRCSRTLVALVAQLADPQPPEQGGGGRYPPGAPSMKPRDALDMMYWIRYEVRSYPLDWSVGILYEMAGLSEEAQALGRYSHEDVVLQVMRQLPSPLLLQFVRRMFLRLACFMLGTAELYGVAQKESLASMVVAFRYGSVLLALVSSVRLCCELLADQFFLELYYLFRTPQVREQLSAVCDNQDPILAGATLQLFEAVLQRIGDAAAGQQAGGGAAGEQAIGHLVNRAVYKGMPGRVT